MAANSRIKAVGQFGAASQNLSLTDSRKSGHGDNGSVDIGHSHLITSQSPMGDSNSVDAEQHDMQQHFENLYQESSQNQRSIEYAN